MELYPSLLVLGKNQSSKFRLMELLTSDFPSQTRKLKLDGVSEWTFLFNKQRFRVAVEESSNFTKRAYLNFSSRNKSNPSVIIIMANGMDPDEDEYYLKALESVGKDQIILVVYGLESRPELQQPIYERKKKYPFVRFWLFLAVRAAQRKFPIMHPTRLLIRQVLVNAFTDRLNHVRGLIEDNLKSKSKALDIGNCGLTSLKEIPALFRNRHLETLIISNEWGEQNKSGRWMRRQSINEGRDNILYDLPIELARLKNLRTLIIGGNWNRRGRVLSVSRWRIEDISVVGKLSQLELLNASNNSIRILGNVTKLLRLKELHLNNNRIIKLPSLKSMISLERLFISNNQIVNARALRDAPMLSTIDLHSNRIENLDELEPLIKKLGIKDSKWEQNTISVANNPLRLAGQLLVGQGKSNVITYLKQQRAEKATKIPTHSNREIKFIVVGNSNVGKSTLVHWLTKKVVKKDFKSTHWMQVVDWNATHRKAEYRVRIFDFGGQEYYHDTHYMFFTNRTAYLLLWDKESNKFGQVTVTTDLGSGKLEPIELQTFPIRYWLDAIDYHTSRRRSMTERQVAELVDDRERSLSEVMDDDSDSDSDTSVDDPTILITQNKVDRKGDKAFLDQASLCQKHPRVAEFTAISVHEKTGLTELKDKLFDIFNTLEVVKEEILGTWAFIRSAMEADQSILRPMDLDEFQKFCNSCIRKMPEVKKLTAKQIKNVLFGVSDTRVFSQFLNDTGKILFYPDHPELRNKVFINRTEIIQNIYDVLSDLKHSKGEFTQSHAANTLNVSTDDIKLVHVLEVMQHFRVVFKHPSKQDTFIAPLYLPKDPVESITLFFTVFKLPRIRYVYKGFIHKYIVQHFFSVYGKHALSADNTQNVYYYWRDGIILKSDISDEIVMVRFQSGTLTGQDSCVEIFTMNEGADKTFVRKVMADLESINDGWDVEKQVSSDGSNFVPLQTVHIHEEAGHGIFEHEGKMHKLGSFKEFLKNPLVMKKIFISYSKQDLHYVTTFVDHLSALQLDGKVAHWYCTELTAGSEWNKQIQEHFDDSDIVCFMISPNFMKTKYIHEHEIAKAFKRIETDAHFKIVPIILDFCRWTTTNNNLGEYTALPYTAKPVADFPNQNQAWYIIESCLRHMIENNTTPEGPEFYSDLQSLPPDVLKLYKRIIAGELDKR